MQYVKKFESKHLNEFDRDDIHAKLYYDIKNTWDDLKLNSLNKIDYSPLGPFYALFDAKHKDYKSDVKKFNKFIKDNKYGKNMTASVSNVRGDDLTAHEYSD